MVFDRAPGPHGHGCIGRVPLRSSLVALAQQPGGAQVEACRFGATVGWSSGRVLTPWRNGRAARWSAVCEEGQWRSGGLGGPLREGTIVGRPSGTMMSLLASGRVPLRPSLVAWAQRSGAAQVGACRLAPWLGGVLVGRLLKGTTALRRSERPLREETIAGRPSGTVLSLVGSGRVPLRSALAARTQWPGATPVGPCPFGAMAGWHAGRPLDQRDNGAAEAWKAMCVDGEWRPGGGVEDLRNREF
jgi:hypothetical protein